MKRVNSIRKGKHGERQAAKYLRSLGFGDSRRGQQHAGGPESPDVVGIPGIHFEVKFGVKGMDLGTRLLTNACIQSIAESTPTEKWCVLWKRHGTRQWLLTAGLTEAIATLHHDETIKKWLEDNAKVTCESQ